MKFETLKRSAGANNFDVGEEIELSEKDAKPLLAAGAIREPQKVDAKKSDDKKSE